MAATSSPTGASSRRQVVYNGKPVEGLYTRLAEVRVHLEAVRQAHEGHPRREHGTAGDPRGRGPAAPGD